MPSLKEQINNNLKEVMRGKEIKTISVLRMLISAIKDKEIAMRKGKDISLNDEQVIEVLSSEIKKRKDSVSAYEQGGREDLAEKERNEIKILEKYLPEQLSDEELEKIVKEIIELGHYTASARNFGKIIGEVMPRVKGKASGGRISEAIKKILPREHKNYD